MSISINKYKSWNDRQSRSHWYSQSNFVPMQGKSYGTITLGRTLRMQYQFAYNSVQNQQYYSDGYYENVFRVGATNVDNGLFGSGSMYPSMWIYYFDHIPYCVFAVSNKLCPVDIFQDLYLIQENEIYSVNITFNPTTVYISISNSTNTHIIVDDTRVWTQEDLIGEPMNVLISDDYMSTPAANITMYNIRIDSWETEHRSKEMNCQIELYFFYNQTNASYWMMHMMEYGTFMRNALILTYQNLTGHSLIYQHFDEYINRSWTFAGISSLYKYFEICMLFNEKITTSPYCPAISNPSTGNYQFVAVVRFCMEADKNVNDFSGYIFEVSEYDIFSTIANFYINSQIKSNEEEYTCHSTLKNPITSTSQSKTKKSSDIVLIAISAAICVVLILTMFLYKYFYTNTPKHRHRICNALAATITIAEYDEKFTDPDIAVVVQDLPLEHDLNHLTELFDLLNYTLLPNVDKLHWTQNDVTTFLENDVGPELFDEKEELKYDALIVCVSSHGIENCIVTSDMKTIEKTAIHRIISTKFPKSREIPRLFLFDACDGSLQRQSTPSPTAIDHTKYYGLENISEQHQWTTTTSNPDYKLIEVHAANAGYQAKANMTFGSYLIYGFTQKVKENLERKKDKTLVTIFDEIQQELHDKGKQQICCTFNNNTRDLLFEVNGKVCSVNKK